jgi:hypothetical protein
MRALRVVTGLKTRHYNGHNLEEPLMWVLQNESKIDVLEPCARARSSGDAPRLLRCWLCLDTSRKRTTIRSLDCDGR